MKIRMLSMSLFALLGLSACGDKSADTAASTSAPSPAATAAPATGDIGVAECDEFLRKYEACLSGKVPEAARVPLQQSLTATRNGWHQAAATPQGRDGLKMACSQARDASRASLQAYGCTDF